MVMVRHLYGLNSSGSSWRTIFAEILQGMYFGTTLDNTNIYRRRARKSNGSDYYELLILYLDEEHCCSHN